MLRSLIAVLLALTLGSVALHAQTIPGTGAGAEEPAEATEATGTDALIELLRDDAAREELIRKLETAAGDDTASDGASGGDTQTESPSVGQNVAAWLQRMTDAASVKAVSAYVQFSRVPGRLSNALKAADPQFLLTFLRDLAFMVIVTYASFFLIRRLSRAISRRLAQAAVARRFIARFGLAVLSSLFDALVVGASVIVALILAFLLVGSGTAVELSLPESAFLTAFAVVELVKVLFRFLISPRNEHLRLFRLQNLAAQRFWSWLSVSIVILGYGQLLLVPVVEKQVGFLAGYALNTVVGAAVILFTLYRVIRNRSEVASWLKGEEDTRRTSFLAGLADYWHWPACLYLIGLLGIVLVRPGNVLLPLLIATSQILGLILAGVVVRNWTIRIAQRGIRLRETTRQMFPALERRLNGILPKALIVVRLLVLVISVLGILSVLGVLELGKTLGSDGLNVTGELLTIVLILAVSLALWLAVASWVDFRLNPTGRRTPTSRETTLLTLLYNAATIAIVVFSTMFILSELGINIGPLIASAGVLGLAIGFGSQKLVQDIITGIFIQFENAINVGDVVTVGGTTGVVEKLTIRSVSLRDVEGIFHIIPFSSVDVVSNYMRDFSYYVCDMGVAYRENTSEVKQAMHEAFDKLRADEEHAKNILGDLEWMGLQAFGDNAVVLRARIKTLPGLQWATGRAYNDIVKTVFDERGIEIPFPHQTVYFGVDRDGHAPPLRIAREDAEG